VRGIAWGQERVLTCARMQRGEASVGAATTNYAGEGARCHDERTCAEQMSAQAARATIATLQTHSYLSMHVLASG